MLRSRRMWMWVAAGSVSAAALGMRLGLPGVEPSPASAQAPAAAAPAKFETDIRPVLEAHCIGCHQPGKKKGGVDLAAFRDPAAHAKGRKVWRRVLEQLDTGAMPPAGEPPLPADKKDSLAAWVRDTLNRLDAASGGVRNPGPAPIRRLTRFEYERTVRDLLGSDFGVVGAVGMTDDTGVEGFDNLAGGLSLPPALLEKYFAAADYLLDRLDGKATVRPGDAKALRLARERVLSPLPGKGIPPRDAARQVIEKFARRAYRRPVDAAEIDRLMGLCERVAGRPDSYETGVRLMLKAVLVSPHFLFKIEADRAPAGSDKPYRVGDHELAVRLSYFLWAAPPDDALSAAADAGKLSDPAEFDRQVKRMLADPKARALTDGFAVQWLGLKKLAEARPSTEFFPTFNGKVRAAMHDEVAEFFDHLRREDRPVTDLLDADYTFLNEDLAKHYGLPGVQGPAMRKVTLKPADHRGGLLGMGAILAMTSHTHRTAPTLRGKWILDVIFGTPPPPPPPDAGQLDESKGKGKDPKSFRELMALHAKQASCAGCHNKMDPLGFGLDNFDAVGRWRDDEGGRPLDVSGVLPTGERFRGPGELKGIIRRRQGEFLRNLAEKTLVYALGRELEYYDEPAVREITAAMEKDGNRFSALIGAVVRSYPFQHRRNADAAGG